MSLPYRIFRGAAVLARIESPSTVHYLKWDPEKGIEEEDIFDITDLTQAEDLVRWFVESAALHD